jgi:hypothetical protein
VYDHETVVGVATEIIAWQDAARQLPLADLRAIQATWQHDLAQDLDALNEAYAGHGSHHECTDVLAHAIGQVTRSATATAIFTLGISQRAQHIAHQN